VLLLQLMELKRDLAIVLRAIPFEERHRIVSALTENSGLITALARNSIQSRRFGGALEPFSASEWHFSQRPGAELCSLSEAHIRRGYEGLRKDFEKLALASVFNELILKLAPQGEPCPDLFRLHSNALAYLEESDKPGADLALLNFYLAKLLQWNGHQPQLELCLVCQAGLDGLLENGIPETTLSCLPADAGWVCPNCRTEQTRHVRMQGGFQNSLLRVSPRAIRDFQWGLLLPIRKAAAIAQASRQEHQELFRFMEALFVFHVPGFDRQPLRGLRFLDVESSLQPLPVSPPRNQLPLA